MANSLTGPPPFWRPTEISALNIYEVSKGGSDGSNDRLVASAWESICHLYFSPASPNPQKKFCVKTEVYNGDPGSKPSVTKRDAVIIRVMRVVTSTVPPSLIPTGRCRDFIWIECHAAVHNTLQGWYGALHEASIRLTRAHPDRRVYLIVAIGLRYMKFGWDPIVQRAAPPLRIYKSSKQDSYWLLDPRFSKNNPECKYVVTDKKGQRFVNPNFANSLDYWTTNASGDRVNRGNLEALHRYFAGIVNRPPAFPGYNCL